MRAPYGPCPVLWCERQHPPMSGNRINAAHHVELDRRRWFRASTTEVRETTLSASLGWQENGVRGPYVAIEAKTPGAASRLAILPIGTAQAVADVMARDAELFGDGGRFIAEAIGLATGIVT